MYEEPDGGFGKRLAEERRNEEQMVVVDPDQVAGPVNIRDALRKCRVDGLVRRPVLVCGCIFRRGVLPEKIVE